jgi:hypothetical protein
MHQHECNTHNFIFNLENQTMDFSYTIFPVKKNKCWKNFKIMIKLLFNYSLYSHPEIGNFRVWQFSRRLGSRSNSRNLRRISRNLWGLYFQKTQGCVWPLEFVLKLGIFLHPLICFNLGLTTPMAKHLIDLQFCLSFEPAPIKIKCSTREQL